MTMKPTKREMVAALIAAMAAAGVSLGLLEEHEGGDLTTCTTAALTDGAGEIWATQACEDIAERLIESMRDELGDTWLQGRLDIAEPDPDPEPDPEPEPEGTGAGE